VQTRNVQEWKGWKAILAETPKRVLWAVKQLDIQSRDTILEVGCGDGSALNQIAPRLTGGRVVGVDRSELAIRAAQKRNREGLTAGTVWLVQSELADLELSERFAKAFALNVNVFWHRPKKELAVLKSLLALGGQLSLMYEPPSADQLDHIAELTRRNLKANGFDVTDDVRAKLPASAALLIKAVVAES